MVSRMASSIARSFKLKRTLFLQIEHHPYGQANGWGHSVSKTQFLVVHFIASHFKWPKC